MGTQHVGRTVRNAALALAVIAMVLVAPLLAASPRANIVFILDGSGSMWGQIDGKAKITIAKEVLTGLIQDLPSDVNVGLVAYGHRTKGDCNDVEELVPLEPLNAGELISKIKAINPKGMTPITLAVRTTVEKLRSAEEETTILLVSDGEETCKGDPCGLVRELKQSGIKFVMHVIGFDVGDKEKAQLECIARAGGGRYFSASNAREFLEASKKVTESISVGEEPGRLTLEKKVFQPFEDVVVSFEARPDYADSAWIGLVPSEVAHTEADSDEHDVAYQYIHKKTSGQMTFQAPRTEGSYDFRMFNTDLNGKETAAVSFEVKGTLGAGTLKVDKEVYAPGEPIQVSFTAGERFSPQAWVGLFASDLPHAKSGPSDEHDTAYRYIEGRSSGTMDFRAPYETGSYDFRMFDTAERDGEEVASVTFKVEGQVAGGTLTLDKTTYRPGEPIRVQFKAQPSYQQHAWVGLIPSAVAHGSSAENDQHDLAYHYLNGRVDGTLEFRAPNETGAYDFRMFDAEGTGKETASVSFTVKGDMEKGTIQLDKSSYRPGEKIVVTFTASPDYQTNAWIGLIPSSVEHGSESVNDAHDVAYQYLRGNTSGTFEFKAPDQPGSYDFRMNNAGLEVGSVSFTVE
ncbi:MAG: VWA domain-containing protein [Acidobacteriota bacterium]